MFERIPDRPGGRCASTDCRFCSPSWRVIVSVSGENEPALTFVAPPVNDGLNGRLAPGHGLPSGSLRVFGPLVISNVELASLGSLPDHGVNDALVVYAP